ncbi:MAG: hypothetical protein ACQETE_00385 [Bacteroidota bacterium]
MKRTLAVLFVIGLLTGCTTSNNDIPERKMIPDQTPFIVSVMEGTDDTVVDKPLEVYVGRAIDVKEENYIKPEFTKIWRPIIDGLVSKHSSHMSFQLYHQNDAQVEVKYEWKGNLQTIQLTNIGEGVYKDVHDEIQIATGKTYTLEVTLDGEQYRAETTIPEQVDWHVPDTIIAKPKLGLFETGTYYEDSGMIKMPIDLSKDALLFVGQWNHEDDHMYFDVEKGDFPYEYAGPYLRKGSNYTIAVNDELVARDMVDFGPYWIRYSTEPLLYHARVWGRVSQLNEDLTKYYKQIFTQAFTPDDTDWYKYMDRRNDAFFSQDTNYYFKTSNIKPVGPSGDTLSWRERKVIGVFGGMSTDYETTVMKAVRTWDPDSVDWTPPENE